MKKSLLLLSTLFVLSGPAAAQDYNILWWDSTPDYGGQALDSFRKEMSDALTGFSGGSVFNSTYVSSETPGTLATHLASNSYDVIVFDATSSFAKFDAADLTAVKAMYSGGQKNILLDGTLYIRSINYDAGSNFPGINGSSAALTVNEVFALAQRGGGFMIGTDHSGYQVDANQILNALVPLASFSGITTPSTDGLWNGNELLAGPSPVAAGDIFAHWDSIASQAIAPTGAFTDFLGDGISFYSQVDVADDPGGGQKYSYISTSFNVSGGGVIITDPNPGGAVPEPATWAMMIGGFALVGGAMRGRTRKVSFAV